MAAISAEAEAFRQCRKSLASLLSTGFEGLFAKLYSAGLVSAFDKQADEFTALGYGNSSKTNKLLDIVEARIQGDKTTHTFVTFRSALCEEVAYEGLVQILGERKLFLTYTHVAYSQTHNFIHIR